MKYYDLDEKAAQKKKALQATTCPIIPLLAFSLIYIYIVPFIIELALGIGIMLLALIPQIFKKKWKWYDTLFIIIGVVIIIVSLIFPPWLWLLFNPSLSIESQFFYWDWWYYDYYYYDYWYWNWGWYALGFGIPSAFVIFFGWRFHWWSRMRIRYRGWRAARMPRPPRP